MKKIIQNDQVVVTAGKNKGRVGKVLKIIHPHAVDTRKRKVLVEGVNLVSKAVRQNPQANEQGGIIKKEAPIHISNVALYNPVTKKAERVGIKVVDGEKRRFFKRTGELVENVKA